MAKKVEKKSKVQPKAKAKSEDKSLSLFERKGWTLVSQVGSGEYNRELARKDLSDKEIAIARATHHQVKVGGKVYRSVWQAFEKLRLPTWDHTKFRKALKLTKGGKATYKFGGKTYNFELVKN